MNNDVFQEASKIRKLIGYYKNIVKSLREGYTIELREGISIAGRITEPEVLDFLIEHYERKIEKLEKEFEDL